MLAGYDVATEQELRLAADIISFGLHALEALSQAVDPALSLNRVLRLRGSAVSLSREAHKSQRKLDQLQRARRLGAPDQPNGAHAQPESAPAQPESAPAQPESAPAQPEITPPQPEAAPEPAHATAEAPREPARAAAKLGQSWLQGFQKRETALRITENLRKSQAEHAACAAHLAAANPVGTPVSEVA
jgi:hypothetical protein